MKRGVRIEQYFLRLTVVVFAVLFFMPAVALSADIYKFERLWPALQQPWYFDYPQGLAVDSNGYVYVADKNHNRIMKLAPDGQLVASWGRFGTGNGEFSNPQGITVDSSGNVYVVDTDNNRIQMFDSKGKYKGQWGSYGTTGNGKFNFPQGGIAVDRKGYVYVADTSNHRVQKFDSNGMYKSQWGSYGDGNTQFNLPKGIAVAPNDEEVYVVDSNNHRVMKFRSDGVYIHQWGTRGEGNLQFQYPNGIAVDRYGDVYVADTSNHRILRFHDDGTFSRKCGEQGFGDGQFISPSGIAVDNDGFVYTTDYNHIQKFTSTRLEFVSKWGSDGAGNGKFNLPVGIAVNSSSIVYVADALNNRIQKFTSEGQYDIQWGSPGAGIGQFNFPTGVAIDSSGYIYVADTNNNRIQKFSPAGQYETQWGTPGVGNRQFNGPTGIAIDSSGYIYVADTGNNRIQKFSPDTQYVTEWGKTGSGDVLLNHPYGVAVGSDGYMYVADTNNNYIKKFTLNGTYERKWGGHPGDDDGDVNFPKGIAVDSEGYVYIADTTKNRIQKFDPNGNFISKYGGPGYGPGLFSTPNYLSINNDKLYIPDPLNNRVQVIKRLSISSNNKAIVVAGGGPYEGNKLWEATQTAANFAYWALMNQGFSSDRIYYLSSDKDKDLDLDGDKISDVDDYAKNTNLQAAVNWASDADNLFVYLVDHGGVDQNGNGTFRMDETEMLSVSQLDSWLGTYQNQPCPTSYLMNESFENGLPAGWTVIDNAGSGAVWRFDDPLNRGNQTGGSGSFAIADSDNAGAVNMNTEMRTPVLNMSNMSTVKLEFRTDFRYYSSGGAEVADVDVSVNGGTDWSTVWHKTGADYRGPHTESIDITGTAAGKNSVIIRFHYYGANYDWWWQVDDVKISGTITSNILAQSFENGLPPGWTVVDNALSGAVWRFDDPGSRGNLTGGPGNFAIADSDNAGAVNMNTELRTPVLDMSGMSTVKLEFRTDFRYYSSGGAEVADVDVSVNGGTDWSTVWQKTGADYRGPKTEVVDISSAAGQNNVMIRFHYYNAAYDWWWQIDDVKISGASTSNSCRQVTFVYDACKSGSFLTALNTPPSGKKRVLVSSASSGESSYFVNQGSVSFSNFFWTDVFNGSNVKEAFDNATSALTTAIDNQTPLLNDGALAQTTYIGNGAIISGDMPTIGSISASAPTQSTATLTADNVTDRDGIARVWAVILPPGYASGASNNTVSGLPSIELMPVEGTLGQYTATYDKFNIADSYGTYNISIYAKDRIGNTSMPMTTTVAVGTPLKRRAIILAGGSQSDANWDGIQKGAQAAYNALKFQGYKDDSEQGCTNNEDICLYSPVAFTSGFDGTSTLSNLQSAIQTWGADSVEDVVLYMIGNGDAGSFNIKGTEPQETLTATQLDTWLDTLQNTIPGKVTVIYDASYSGAFNSKLADPNRDRILIGSSGGQAYFLSDGDISFSNYFWKRIMNGWNVRDAFYNARSAMEFSTAQEQKAWIDDNGNGTGNESSDGSVAFNYTIGVGIRLAGKDPMIGSVSAIPNTLTGALSTLIRADDVTTVGTLAAVNPVWAVVTSPKGPGDSEGSQTIVVLSDVGNNRYEGSTGNIFNAFGKYEVAVFAKDDAGDISSVSQ
ncbi:MAG: SMP-30/gluconolactonase/LRE family protein, partial [Nitrospirae bacterium]|nr:SMP-30/gluconolactonase/LRE family protein [Nitrospirota bacterium]